MKSIPVALVVLAGLLSAGVAAQQVFRSRVDVVAIYPLVLDKDGRMITDLTKDEFQVLDEGKPAEILTFGSETRAISAVLLLDMSGSMQSRVLVVRDAAMQLVGLIEPRDRLRLGTFGSEVMISPHFTNDRATLERVLRTELWPGGMTPLWRAIDDAISRLAGVDGRRTVITLSDGSDTSHFSRDAVLERAVREQVMVYAVRLPGAGVDGKLLDVVRDTGGGEFRVARDADLASAMTQVMAELRHQYLIGFAPNVADGRAHRIQVRVSRPGLTVRAPARVRVGTAK